MARIAAECVRVAYRIKIDRFAVAIRHAWIELKIFNSYI